MKDLLKQLCALPGVSSFEDAVRNFIKEQAAPYVDSVKVDAMGNLICFKKGAKATGNKLMLCAHMDEVGLMVRSVTEDGYLKFVCVGGMDRRVLLGKQVLVGDRQVPGVIGLKAIHMTTAQERKKVPKLEDYYIDMSFKIPIYEESSGRPIPKTYAMSMLRKFLRGVLPAEYKIGKTDTNGAQIDIYIEDNAEL